VSNRRATPSRSRFGKKLLSGLLQPEQFEDGPAIAVVDHPLDFLCVAKCLRSFAKSVVHPRENLFVFGVLDEKAVCSQYLFHVGRVGV
jgi:hypothetical protein